MLKFADLRVDMKSSEKSLDSFMKLFPKTYLPLLIMYLSREGLLKVKSDVDEDDPRVLLRISSNEIVEFFGPHCFSSNKNTTKEESAKVKFDYLGIDYSKKDWINDIDSDVLLSLLQMIKKGETNQYFFLIYDCDNKEFNKVKDILCANSSLSNEPAAFWLFCEFLIQQCPAISKDSRDCEIPNSIRLFDSVLEKQQRFSKDKIYMQPHNLTRIILSQYKRGSVYNPFAGLASYHVEMAHGLRKDVGEKGCYFYNYDTFYNEGNSLGEYYYGEEIDELTWAIGKLRLMFYHMDSPNYILGDSTKEIEGSVNNILCTPPFNLQIINENGEKEYADHFVLRRGVNMLADDGMMAVVVPTSFFRRRDSFDIRKNLVTRHLLTRIVYLPENIFHGTRISTAIIFVEKASKSNRVKFVDATKMVIGGSMLNIDAISNLIEHDEHPMNEWGFTFGGLDAYNELTPTLFNTCICFETYSDIGANDYDLSPSNYFPSYIDIPEGFKLERLDDLVSHREFLKASREGMQIIVQTRDLAKDYNLPYIERVNLAAGIATPKFNLLDIDEKALLISSIGELRPSILGPLYSEVYISPKILAFHLDDKRVNPEYLVGELSKDYVKEQLRLNMMGKVNHRIEMYDARNLQILVPVGKDFLRKEEEIVQERKNKYLEKIGVELAELKDKRHDEYVKMLRQRKHRIQQVMNELTPAFALLNQCRLENGGILRDGDIVAKRTGETVDSYFNRLHTIVEKVEDLVTNFVEKDHWEDSEVVDIDSFVNEIPQQHLSDKYQFQVYINRDVEIYEEGEIDLNDARMVKANKNDLSIVFDNIIANATKWGFNEAVRRDYTIRIEVFDGYIDNRQAVRICVSNNGTPIHPSVDRKRFFEWGYGSGTGIGTWQLKDIIEHYGGTIKLNEYPDEISGFQTEYEIILPLFLND